MDISPINKNIIILVDKEADVTETGIVTAYSKGERTAAKAIKGKVVAIAEDFGELEQSEKAAQLVSKKPKVEIGQIVWVQKWEGQELSYNGAEYIFIKHEHILGVLPNKNA